MDISGSKSHLHFQFNVFAKPASYPCFFCGGWGVGGVGGCLTDLNRMGENKTKKGKPGEMLEKVAVASAGAPSDNLGTYLNADKYIMQINCK